MSEKRSRPKAKTCKAADSSDLLRAILDRDNSDRRIVILRALWRLILKKGYANTSLTDIAKKARISPSHLVYYFRTKEAILLELCRALFNALLSGITTHGHEPPEEQCERLASYAFLEPAIPLSDRSIVLELIGLAVHNPRLRRSTFDYAEKMLAYLRELFAKTPRAFDLSTEDAALLATSLWSGLLTNSYYHKDFDRSRARELFRRNLLMLAGLSDDRSISSKRRRDKVLQEVAEHPSNGTCDRRPSGSIA
jgi:AcrR family transcriptional regulator